MRTFLFGAGASHSYESPTGVRPPLAKGVFSAYSKLAISRDRQVLVGHIVNYVASTRSVPTFHFSAWNEDIESFMSELDDLASNPLRLALLGRKEAFQVLQAYNQMIFLLASVLNEIQNGPVCANYSRLLASMDASDALITFNWDTLLDRALFETGTWHPADGYGVRFRSLFMGKWVDGATAHDLGGRPSTRHLLKLHGSTNWLMPYRMFDLQNFARKDLYESIDPMNAPIYGFIHADGWYDTYQGRMKAGYAPFSCYYYPPNLPLSAGAKPGFRKLRTVSAAGLPDHGMSAVDDHSVPAMPVLVPPVRVKDYHLAGPTLQRLWDAAAATLANTDELIVVGYSFPITDTRAWELLDTGMNARSSPLRMSIVDPFPESIVRRVEERWGDRVVVAPLKQTFDEYVAGLK